MKRIVFVTTEYASRGISSGGLASFTSNISRLFAEQGNDVRVILVTTKEEYHEVIGEVKFENIYIKKEVWEEYNQITELYGEKTEIDSREMRGVFLNLLKAQLVTKRLLELNDKEGIDIVHFCNHGALYRFIGDRIPFVVRISGFYNYILGEANTIVGSVEYDIDNETIRDLIEKKALKTSKNVICPSKLMAEMCENIIGIKCKVLRSPVILHEEEWDYELYDDKIKGKKYILNFGTISYLKGLGVILKFIYELLDEHKGIYFVFAGQDTMIEYFGKTMLASSAVKLCAKEHADRVIMLGRINREKLYPIIMQSGLCVLPSRIENFSNACIEAMALGRVVVATNGASYEEIIDDGVNGFLCKRDDDRDFLRVLNLILNMEDEEIKKIGNNAIYKVEVLDSIHIYREYYDYYMSIVNKRI